MHRAGLRLLMAGIGLTLLACYLSLSLVAFALLRWAWAVRPDPLTTVALLAASTAVLGYLSYRYGTRQLLATVDAAPVPHERAPGLYRRVETLAARMSVDPPALMVARLEAPNAMAVGGVRDGVLVVDRSLFHLLDGDELETILAHELAHLESRDGLVQTLAYSAVRTLVGLTLVPLLPVLFLLTGLGRAGAWLRGRPFDHEQGVTTRVRLWLGRAVTLVLLMLTLLVRAHSRRREFAADDRAVAVTGKPDALARALRKIERAAQPRAGLLATLYTHGRVDDPLTELLSTHPATDERVERLARGAGKAERRRV
jgi:heat shock protein HtpX